MKLGIGSLVCAFLALVFMLGGFVFSVVPFLGTVLSFSSPVLALVGIVLGGLGLSRAGQMGEGKGPAIAGLVVSVVVLLPALVVAVTCGLCNACLSAGTVMPRPDGGPYGSYDYDYEYSGADDLDDYDGVGDRATGDPVDLSAPPTAAELAREVEMMNELCPDTWCEGEFDWRFQTLTCEGSSCRLTFETKHWRSPEDAPYQASEFTIAAPPTMECSSSVGNRCVERGLTGAWRDAFNAALSAWERENAPPR